MLPTYMNYNTQQTSSIPPILHVALATYPYGQSQDFIKAVYDPAENEGYYLKYKEGIKRNNKGQALNPKLYKPGIYHLFGNYDVAFISFIDNYKFAQKLLRPEKVGTDFKSNTFQIITGITLATSDDFETDQQPKFVSVCNLKLNNGLLIGNGQEYINAVTTLIKETIAEYNKGSDIKVTYALMQSFSWAELCLVIFCDKVKGIPDIITELRGKKVEALNDDIVTTIKSNSLYSSILDKSSQIDDCHIFSDSHSYFGVKFSDFENEINIDDELITETEWMVKPGHIEDLTRSLFHKDKKIFNQDVQNKAYFIHGKTDYTIQPEGKPSQSIQFNQRLFRELIKKKSDIHHHVRKVKTRVFFDTEEYKKGEIDTNQENEAKLFENVKPISLYNKCIELSFTKDKLTEINGKLEKMKVSRQIRDKVSKVFNNYNTGIKDPVLFTFFLDFHPFMIKLEELISAIESTIDKQWENFKETQYDKISTIEKYLDKYISVFEEGYHIRMLNCYMYEEIDDFDLDFNSSIQQLLTTYNTLIYELAKTFDTFKKDKYAPVVSLNLKQTVSNLISINYNVYHLTTPELVFSTIIKEIFNSYEETIRQDEKSKSIYTEIRNSFNKSLETHKLIKSMYDSKQIEFERIYIDIVRVIYTFNSDFNLFGYWFWTFNLQNSSLYNSRGSFNEDHFKMELFRYLYVYRIFFNRRHAVTSKDWSEITCPIPQLQIYWDRYYTKFSRAIKELLDEDEDKKTPISLLKKSNETLNKRFINDVVRFWEENIDIGMKLKLENLASAREAELNNFYIMHQDLLRQGKPILFDINKHSELLLFINQLMYTYLKVLYDVNEKKMCLLRRNAKTGKLLKMGIYKEDKDSLFHIDPLGGFFFTNSEKTEMYNKILNAMLQSIWHFSQVMKKDYIKLNIK